MITYDSARLDGSIMKSGRLHVYDDRVVYEPDNAAAESIVVQFADLNSHSVTCTALSRKVNVTLADRVGNEFNVVLVCKDRGAPLTEVLSRAAA